MFQKAAYTFIYYAVPLLLTIAVEAGIAYICGIKPVFFGNTFPVLCLAPVRIADCICGKLSSAFPLWSQKSAFFARFVPLQCSFFWGGPSFFRMFFLI